MSLSEEEIEEAKVFLEWGLKNKNHVQDTYDPNGELILSKEDFINFANNFVYGLPTNQWGNNPLRDNLCNLLDKQKPHVPGFSQRDDCKGIAKKDETGHVVVGGKRWPGRSQKRLRRKSRRKSKRKKSRKKKKRRKRKRTKKKRRRRRC